MFRIYADNICIYDDVSPLQSAKLSNPKLTLEDSAAGKLSFVMPVINRGYEHLKPFSTKILVYRNDDIIFEGRALTEKSDFWKSRSIECEGTLAFLNDTIQPQAEFDQFTPSTYLEAVLDAHNEQVSSDKRILLGTVDVNAPADGYIWVTDFNTSLDSVNNMVKDLGGHMEIEWRDGKRYLNYWADYPRNSTQTIRFGKNLIDFTKSFNAEDYCTVCVPRGVQLESEDEDDAFTRYLTVESVNGGSIYVVSEEAVEEYGWIARVVDFDDVDDPNVLLEKAHEYLSSIQFNKMEIELNAFDLSYLNVDAGKINLLDRVRVVSTPHGLDRYFPVRKIELDLSDISQSKYTLGDSIDISYTGAAGSAISEIRHQVDNLPTKENVIQIATDRATKLINSADGGYVHILTNEETGLPEEIVISDIEDYTSSSAHVWRWNHQGLGYSPTGYYGTFVEAMTSDGEIVCERLSAGIVEGLTLKGSELIAEGSKRFLASDYDNSDIQKMLDWINGLVQPDTADLMKYDFTLDGKITNQDYQILIDLLQNGLEYYDAYMKIVIKPDIYSDKLISFQNEEYGSSDYYYGALGLKTRNAEIDTLTSDLIDAKEVSDQTAIAVKDGLARIDTGKRYGRIRLYGGDSNLIGYLSVSSRSNGGRDSLELELTCTQTSSVQTTYLIATSDILYALGYEEPNRRISLDEGSSGFWFSCNNPISYELGSYAGFDIEPSYIFVPAGTIVIDEPGDQVCVFWRGSAWVRSSPEMLDYNKIGVVSTGQSYPYLGYDEASGWYKIFYEPKNCEGYVYKDYVKEVTGTPETHKETQQEEQIDDGNGAQYLELGVYSDQGIVLVPSDTSTIFFNRSMIRISLNNVILPDERVLPDYAPNHLWWTQTNDILQIDASSSAIQTNNVLEIV